MGAGIVQTLVSAGVGAGTGALMRNSPGWATGAVAGGGGSVVSQVVNSFIPQGGGYRQSSYYAPGTATPNSSRRPYGASGSTPLYYQRPDGSFVRVNPSYQ